MPDGASIDRIATMVDLILLSLLARLPPEFSRGLSGSGKRERERERTFILEGNRAPVAKATHSRNREGPVRPRVRRQD